MFKRILRLLVFLLGLFAFTLVFIVGWLFISKMGGGEAKEVMPSLEDALIRLYLLLRRDEISRPCSEDSTPLTFIVERGETAATIASRLEQLGLIKDSELFRLYLRAHGLDARLEAGEYKLRADMTMEEIAEALQLGRPGEVIITIPEGWRMEQVAEMLSEETGISGEQFLAIAREFDYDFLPEGATLEGFLFPDTYRLRVDASALELVELMLSTFEERFTPEMREEARRRGMTVYEVVTLASIVEREAVIPEERPIIASVYLNRLKAGMRLEADPTVQYALGYQEETGQWWKRPMKLEEYASIDSPYNTYIYYGLPPGPICSPGLDSLRAVVYPAETEYLFFCSKGDGSHAFARTFEEHIRNQEKYRRQLE